MSLKPTNCTAPSRGRQQLTVLLAVRHELGPVTRVGLLVVEQAADTELLGGGAVPAGPVARAGRLVAEDAVQPVTVLSGDGRVWWGREEEVRGEQVRRALWRRCSFFFANASVCWLLTAVGSAGTPSVAIEINF